jgi:hypothetical protein
MLFGQSENGLAIGRAEMKRFSGRILPPTRDPWLKSNQNPSIYVSRNNAAIKVTRWDEFRPPGADGLLARASDFQLFGPRLAVIQQEMRNWRPTRASELFKPGYGDRFNWYTQMFALLIAVIGTVGLILSIAQTAIAVQTYRDSMDVARQGLELAWASFNLSLVALNVSLEALELQRMQMNLTS